MCTVILDLDRGREVPLVVAANRDERYVRPSAPPRWEVRSGVEILAPRDLQAGGTWIGVNTHGVFAALTNRYPGPAEPDRRSRGELVFTVLEAGALGAALAAGERIDATDYNGFHLLVASAADAVAFRGDGRALRRIDLGVGTHVVTERSFADIEPERAARIRERLPQRSLAALTKTEWRAVLAWHDGASIAATCVHEPLPGYGTRSSSLVRWSRDGWEYFHADGRPCETPLERVR